MGNTHEGLLTRKPKKRRSYTDESSVPSETTPQVDSVVALQQKIGNRAVQRQLTIQRKFDDVPTLSDWKTASSVRFHSRSKELGEIDTVLGNYNKLQGGSNFSDRRSKLSLLLVRINGWLGKKTEKYGQGSEDESDRHGAIMDLKQAVEDKLQTLTGIHQGLLAPIIGQYHQAATSKDIAKTHDLALMIQGEDNDLFVREATQAMTTAKGTDIDLWKTYYFSAPAFNFGAGPFALYNMKSIGNYNWMDGALADTIIKDFLPDLIASGSSQQAMMLMQDQDFRGELKAKASAPAYKQLSDTMPLVRIADETEANMQGEDYSDIDKLAQTVFDAFLNDLPISGLIYSTGSIDFKTLDFLLGNHDKKNGAPCMMLSSVFEQLFKAVTKVSPQVEQKGDDKPLLTKQLATIGKDGILTRDNSFKGNVEVYDDAVGSAAINRVFFGDGHIWLEVNGKEYDPTLGISGPKGTVAATVEKFFTKTKKGFTDGRLHVTRNEVPPPGGAPLNFVRTVFIEDPKKPKKKK